MNHRLRACVLALVLVAGACGGDDDSDSDAGGTPDVTAEFGEEENIMEVVRDDPLSGSEGSGLTRGVTDDTVTLGCVWDARSYAGFLDGARARLERANQEGGVHGREIVLESCEDDAADPAQFQSLTTELVEQDEVFGLLTIEGVIPQAAFDYLNENEVPYTGWGFLPGFCGTRWGFGWGGCAAGQALPDAVPHAVYPANLSEAIIGAAGLDASEVRVAVQAEDAESGTLSEAMFAGVFENVGAEAVYTATNMPVSGVTDYTPFVQELMAAEPNVVVVATNFTNVGGFTASLTAAGYEGVIVNFVSYIPGLLDASPQLADALEGTYVNTQVVPQEQQTPYIAQIEEDLEAVGAETGTFITLGAAMGYAQANLWVGLLEAAGEDLDTATFDQAVNGDGVTVTPGTDGGIGDVSFPEHHFVPSDCAAVMQVVEGAFTVAEEFGCYEPQRIR